MQGPLVSRTTVPGQGLTWALRYDWRRSEYEISAPWENQQATAELGFWVNSQDTSVWRRRQGKFLGQSL